MKQTLTGFPKVFGFTMKMTTGSASWKRTTVIFAAILFLIPFLILTITTALGDSEAETVFTGTVHTLYTVDETDPVTDYSLITATDPDLSTIHVVPCTDYDEAKARLLSDENGVLLYVTRSDGMYDASLITGDDTAVSDDDLGILTGTFYVRFGEILALKSGMTTEEMMQVIMPITVNPLNEPDGDPAPEEPEDFADESTRELLGMLLPYVTVMFLYFFVLFYGQGAAQLIVMEKTSKLMDTILVSVRPAAMIFGKFAANLCCAVIQLAAWLFSLLIGALAGFAVSSAIDPVNAPKLSDVTDALALLDGMFTPGGIVLALLLMLSGCILYCSLASIGGAAAGKQEDLQSTNMLFTMSLVISFMAVVFGGNLFETGEMANAAWMHFVPFTAVLITPSQVLLGNVSPLLGLLSLALTLLFSALILLCAGRIYRLMSFYKGNPPKLKQILGMLKTK
ncbi:MAG: ABC transporter permease [Clostridia bacterium]|nr:ABC transporter permease [Clostridia bacterium]